MHPLRFSAQILRHKHQKDNKIHPIHRKSRNFVTFNTTANSFRSGNQHGKQPLVGEKRQDMNKHYLFFCSHGYAIPILRPLQQEILRRGDHVAWFLEATCSNEQLTADDLQLHTLSDVKTWNPRAVFAPGNWVYDFFPGVKVELFHGFPINKRNDAHDDHFRLRGWFDIYCTQGASSTQPFLQLEKKHGNFKVYETGWVKTDALMSAKHAADATAGERAHHHPHIFVATTFSKGISSLATLYSTIARLSKQRDWRWMITLHPKLQDEQLKAKYTELARTHDNVEFYPITPSADVIAETDVMLCDASSIILEYMMLDKPVVTYRNTSPGAHLIDVQEVEDIEAAIETALTRPQPLLDAMRQYLAFHEAHRDGHNCERILDAVDDFIANWQGKLKRKPLNLFRKWKIRWKYWRERNKSGNKA